MFSRFGINPIGSAGCAAAYRLRAASGDHDCSFAANVRNRTNGGVLESKEAFSFEHALTIRETE
jgi:hypothetical protein